MTLEALREDWTGFAESTGNVFSTYEWADAWWRHFGDGELQAEVSGDALLPLYLGRSGPFRVLRFIGHGPADELGPVAASPEAGLDALAARLNGGGYSLFLGENMRAAPPGARVVERTESPVLELGRGWDALLESWSTNLRQQVGRFERRLEREHDLRYRLVDELDTLFRLHRLRWPSSPWFTDAESFHRDFAAVARERGWLRVWLLELDGQPVAAWLGYRFAGVEAYYQAGRDPAFDGKRVGFVLLAHTIREAANDGLREYRFGVGGERFKYRFATSDPGVVTAARPHGLAGRAALAARSTRRRLRAAFPAGGP